MNFLREKFDVRLIVEFNAVGGKLRNFQGNVLSNSSNKISLSAPRNSKFKDIKFLLLK
jgi:hypothetical protein